MRFRLKVEGPQVAQSQSTAEQALELKKELEETVEPRVFLGQDLSWMLAGFEKSAELEMFLAKDLGQTQEEAALDYSIPY